MRGGRAEEEEGTQQAGSGKLVKPMDSATHGCGRHGPQAAEGSGNAAEQRLDNARERAAAHPCRQPIKPTKSLREQEGGCCLHATTGPPGTPGGEGGAEARGAAAGQSLVAVTVGWIDVTTSEIAPCKNQAVVRRRQMIRTERLRAVASP